MITSCRCSREALASLGGHFGLIEGEPVDGLEVEFRELPYFIVSRSREQWNPEAGRIDGMLVVAAGERGLVVDPDAAVEGSAPAAAGGRRTLIPWSNIVSLTVTRAARPRIEE